MVDKWTSSGWLLAGWVQAGSFIFFLSYGNGTTSCHKRVVDCPKALNWVLNEKYKFKHLNKGRFVSFIFSNNTHNTFISLHYIILLTRNMIVCIYVKIE
jgi:hypothetical protein